MRNINVRHFATTTDFDSAERNCNIYSQGHLFRILTLADKDIQDCILRILNAQGIQVNFWIGMFNSLIFTFLDRNFEKS